MSKNSINIPAVYDLFINLFYFALKLNKFIKIQIKIKTLYFMIIPTFLIMTYKYSMSTTDGDTGKDNALKRRWFSFRITCFSMCIRRFNVSKNCNLADVLFFSVCLSFLKLKRKLLYFN